uniref:ATP synthase F0 subunit 8 n=1 Tax=Inocellia sinensis TaxID=3018572 RepID=UPI0022FD5CB9|nr:ATP synthase F0 subunit 8 [Inocellia sinensis]WBK02670.1 ATP synthase F0 subunit 8 [Inocellia sinensis]WBK02917.1 ATP synthase F0 subunit 8 [Inocellia sinensis]
MPQMAPMNWLILYIIFISLYMLFMTKNYYLIKINFKSMTLKSLPLHKNYWKW